MIGLCSVTFRDKEISEIINLVKEVGLEAIEWGSDSHVPETEPAKAEQVANLMAEAGLETSSYGSYYQLGSNTDFMPFITIANILGAKNIRVWAGNTGSAETNQSRRRQIIQDTQRIGDLAEQYHVMISIEYHQKTLTDTPTSALQLMKDINHENVKLYWQPAESLTVEERKSSLVDLAPWVTNIHVFNWENYMNRFPLANAKADWQDYIDLIEKYGSNNHHYLLEFVPGDDPIIGFKESAKTLKELIR